jgi:hypothetical protein
MTIKGLEPLLAMRKAGKLPGRNVILWADREPSRWGRHADAIGMPEGRITAKDDLRVLIRLDVILVANRFTAEVAKINELLRSVASSVILISLSADDGLVWDREKGERWL